MKKNKIEQYSLFLENEKTPVGTAWVDKNSLYISILPNYQQALKVLVDGSVKKGSFSNVRLGIKGKYIEIKPVNEMFLKATKQESSLFLKIHFIEELVS